MTNNQQNTTIEQMQKASICIVIPTFNNAGTLREVISSVQSYCADIIVVNDGSTDSTAEILADFRETVRVVSYTPNRGKGYALKRGFLAARALGFRYAITLDADGQHLAHDLPAFLAAIQNHPDSLIIGSRTFNHPNMPARNTFANRFSNFWFAVQTGTKLPDTQTGYRLYPLRKLGKLWGITRRYEAEVLLLVRSAWRCIPLVPIPIEVYYPPQNERVTHFHPVKDFVRISVLNTILCLLAVVWGYPSMLVRKIFHSV